MAELSTHHLSTEPRFRPFGLECVDLNVDFSVATPVLVNQLLAVCADRSADNPNVDDPIDSHIQVDSPPRIDNRAIDSCTIDSHIEASALMQWSLAKRLQALLQLVIDTRGDALTLDVTCPRSSCREAIELPVQLSWFLQPVEEGLLNCVVGEGVALTIRLPNGYDQLCWSQQAAQAGDVSAMFSRLLLAVNDRPVSADEMSVLLAELASLDTNWVERVEQTLEQHDPLMTLELQTDCPACGLQFNLPLDLELQLLSLLQREQRILFNQVHTLAQHYHWNEGDIMALPPRRRRYYISLLQREEGWL